MTAIRALQLPETPERVLDGALQVVLVAQDLTTQPDAAFLVEDAAVIPVSFVRDKMREIGGADGVAAFDGYIERSRQMLASGQGGFALVLVLVDGYPIVHFTPCGLPERMKGETALEDAVLYADKLRDMVERRVKL